KLKISSLGPQLFVLQGHSDGPPMGLAKLLITFVPCCDVPTGGPETPLPWSGSAQRAMKVSSPLGILYLPRTIPKNPPPTSWAKAILWLVRSTPEETVVPPRKRLPLV